MLVQSFNFDYVCGIQIFNVSVSNKKTSDIKTISLLALYIKTFCPHSQKLTKNQLQHSQRALGTVTLFCFVFSTIYFQNLSKTSLNLHNFLFDKSNLNDFFLREIYKIWKSINLATIKEGVHSLECGEKILYNYALK